MTDTMHQRWRSVASLRHPEDLVDERGSGMGRRIHSPAVPEPKTVKNRAYLDLLVGAERHDVEVERLLAFGATVLSVHDGGGRWTLLVDRKATNSTFRERWPALR